jgi:hypothetical protein
VPPGTSSPADFCPTFGFGYTVNDMHARMWLRWVAGCATVGCAVVLTACGSSSPRSGPDRPAAAAIHAAVADASDLGAFPKTPSIVPCIVQRGGPNPNVFIAATCATHVEPGPAGSHIVRLTETWDGRVFRAQDSPALPVLSHTWSYTVAARNQIVAVASTGDFPPQMVR